jgi:polysaccharide biosynthesis transport protein
MSLSNPPPDEKPSAAPLDVNAIIGGCLRRWKLIVIVPLVALAAVYGLLRLVPAVYESGVKILIFDPQAQRALALGQPEDPEREFDMVAINTEMEVIKSTSLATRVAKELKLDEDPEFQHHSRIQPVLNMLGLGALYGPRDQSAQMAPESGLQTAIGLLREHIRVDRVPLSYVLMVSATSHSAQMARRLAATMVDDYFAGQREARQAAFDQSAVWLKAKLAELKSRVAETQTEIEKLKARAGFTDTGKGNINEQQIADSNAEMTVIRADVAEKRARLEQARQMSSGGTLQDIPDAASPVIGQLRVQQSLLTRREQELRKKLGPSHAEVLAVAAQLAGVNKAIDDEGAHVLTDLQNSYDVAVRREKSVEASLQQLTSAQGQSSDYINLQQLQRIADADSKLYETYLSQYNEIGTRASFGNSNERIITAATVPRDPIFPKPRLFYAVGGGLGLVLGVLLAILIEYLRPSVMTRAQAEQIFGRPVVGAIPRVKGGGNRGLVQALTGAPASPFGEAVRTLRIGLLLSNVNESPKVVLVTSCLPGEGKSAVSAVMAASSANAGLRTALVDCDLRGRGISRDFGKPAPGLTELLSGKAEIDEVAFHDPLSGCDVIAAGSIVASPGDLLRSKMAKAVATLRERYDYIVIDTPPILSVVDTVALAPMADKILMTIDAERVRHDDLVEAQRLLKPEMARVAGMVFNKVDPTKLWRYGYRGYPLRDLPGLAVAEGG